MKSISGFLDKFKNLEHPDQKKEALAKVIFLETSIVLDKKQIDWRGKTVFLKTNSYIKAEIFLKKESLLKKINESRPGFKITDIR